MPTLLKVCRLCDEKITLQLMDLSADHQKQLVKQLHKERQSIGATTIKTTSNSVKTTSYSAMLMGGSVTNIGGGQSFLTTLDSNI